MQLRRFTADTTPAALNAVRMAFGDDAIILANRRLGNQVEIIATGNADEASAMAQFMAEEALSEGKRNQAAQSIRESERPEPVSIQELSREIDSVTLDEPTLSLASGRTLEPDVVKLSGHAGPVESVPAPVQAEQRAEVPAQLPAEEQESAKPANRLINDSAAAAQESPEQLALRPASEPSGVDTPVLPAWNGAADALRQARSDERTHTLLQQIVDSMQVQAEGVDRRFHNLEINLWGDQSPVRSQHLRRLFALGIGAELAIRLVERVQPDVSVELAIRQSLALLKATLPIGKDRSLSEPGITVFSGPPGSGKTTAMIKLATEHVRRCGNQSIVIIGADLRRIGAFEELQAYGRLLGVPTVMAHDTAELANLADAFAHKQLVLVDHGLADADRGMELPESLLQRPSSVFRQLFVLPATLQAINANAMISRYCQSGRMHCVLTHLDSPARLGELFNAIIRHHLPIAYWSDSQSVQAPLEKADASVLVATAVAMSRRVETTADDDWLQRLIQPAHQLMREPLLSVEAARRLDS